MYGFPCGSTSSKLRTLNDNTSTSPGFMIFEPLKIGFITFWTMGLDDVHSVPLYKPFIRLLRKHIILSPATGYKGFLADLPLMRRYLELIDLRVAFKPQII